MITIENGKIKMTFSVPIVLEDRGVVISGNTVLYDYVESILDLYSVCLRRVAGIVGSESGIRIYFESNDNTTPTYINITTQVTIEAGEGKNECSFCDSKN